MRMTAIAEALVQGDAKALARAAHTLKGAVSVLCDNGPTLVVRELELAAKEGDLELARALHPRLEQQIELLRQNLLALVRGGCVTTAPSPIRLLVVDDDARFPDYLRILLRKASASFEIEVAATLVDGLRELSRGTHHVCLLDYRLGDQDGLDVLRSAQVRAPPDAHRPAHGRRQRVARVRCPRAGSIRLRRQIRTRSAPARANTAARDRPPSCPTWRSMSAKSGWPRRKTSHTSWSRISRSTAGGSRCRGGFVSSLAMRKRNCLHARLADVTHPDDLEPQLSQQRELLQGSSDRSSWRSDTSARTEARLGVPELLAGDRRGWRAASTSSPTFAISPTRSAPKRPSGRRSSGTARWCATRPTAFSRRPSDGRFLAVNPALAPCSAFDSEQDALLIDPDASLRRRRPSAAGAERADLSRPRRCRGHGG